MGARSTGSHPTTTKADGHLIEYFRNAFSVGGGANSGPTEPPPVKATGGTRSDYGDNTIHQLKATGSLVFPDQFNKDVFYVVVGGGGGGGADISGGGGAGAWRQGTIPVTGPVTIPVSIGAGGAGGGYPSDPGSVGGNTTFAVPGSPIVSPGGGYGRRGGDGGPGGSGGAAGEPSGSGGNGTGDPYPGDNTASSPSNGWGHNGGGSPSGGAGAGGGGAGSAGVAGANPGVTGKGGDGIQLRPEFHNSSHPETIGAAGFAAGTPGNFFLAGGGGGGAYPLEPHPAAEEGGGGGGNPTPETRGAGGGYGGKGSSPYAGNPGVDGTGGGGGGGGPTTATRVGGDGGDGVVLIYYNTTA